MSLKARIINFAAMVAVGLVTLKLISGVEFPPSVSTLGNLMLAALALTWIASIFMNAAQESGKKLPAFLASGAALLAVLSILIRSAVEFETISQAYLAFIMVAAPLSLTCICLWQLQSALRRGMPRTADSYLFSAALLLVAAVGAMLDYMELAALMPFSRTAFEIALYAPIIVGFLWMQHRLNQIQEAQERLLETGHAERES